MRLMSAAPRDVAANNRSSEITLGLRAVIVSIALSGSLSLNVNTSPSSEAALCFSASSSSSAPMMTVQGVDINAQVYCRISRQNETRQMHHPTEQGRRGPRGARKGVRRRYDDYRGTRPRAAEGSQGCLSRP